MGAVDINRVGVDAPWAHHQECLDRTCGDYCDWVGGQGAVQDPGSAVIVGAGRA
jgi:hypothetical protein